MSSALYCFARCAHIYVHLFSPPPGYWYVYLFLLYGRSRSPIIRKRSCSVFAESIGSCKYTFSFLFLPSTPRISPSAFSIPPCFLVLAFPLFLSFLLLLPCTSQTSRRTSPLLGFPLHPSKLSQLRYPTLFSSPLCHFVPYSAINCLFMAGNLFFGIYIPYFIPGVTISTFSYISLFICLEWVHPQFCSKYCITSRT